MTLNDLNRAFSYLGNTPTKTRHSLSALTSRDAVCVELFAPWGWKSGAMDLVDHSSYRVLVVGVGYISDEHKRPNGKICSSRFGLFCYGIEEHPYFIPSTRYLKYKL